MTIHAVIKSISTPQHNRETARPMSSVYAWVLAATLSAFSALIHADNGKTILVLDASGSMWQKIDDGYKIRIAQDVINGLLKTLPADQELGLMTYGHRRKGDCSDIELLVAPGKATRQAIAESVASLDPKGKTPLSAAVIQAADELRIEENAATVILVSDGRETCNLDPCAVGNELEDRGIDFTTHVIGFDIAEANDREQLRCLAENTGGRFLTASTAFELTQALAEVSQPIQTLTLTASVEDDEKTHIAEGITWSLTASPAANNETDNSSGSLLTEKERISAIIRKTVNSGTYTLSVSRAEDGASTSLDINVDADKPNRFVLTLPTLQRSATIESPASVIIGSPIEIFWEGPADSGDRILLSQPDAVADAALDARFITRANPVVLTAPSEPGEYKIHYWHSSKRISLASAVLIVEAAPATLLAVDSAAQATSIDIEWTGPGQRLDYIAVVKPGDSQPVNRTQLTNGSPVRLQMPPESGSYELRYLLFKDNKTLATRPIEITEADVSLSGPDSAGVGARIPVTWSGPDEKYDFVAVSEIGSDAYINQKQTVSGNPLTLQMPTKPGEFELRYVSFKFNAVLARSPISVTETLVTLQAPEEAVVGESVVVIWQGPDEKYDHISVAKVGEQASINSTRTDRGNPLKLQMPAEPGEYEIRYKLFQDNTTLASRPVTVVTATVSIDAPDEASAGESILVTWEGPDELYDRIAVAEVGEKATINNTRTDRGNPLKLQMPAKPGEYEIRYVLHQGSTTLTSRMINIVEGKVSVDAPDQASVGESIVVSWEGPDEQYDSITVAQIGEKTSINNTRTDRGNPLKLQMPTKPGDYEIRYVLHNGRTTLASRPVTVVAANVMLDTVEQASVGESVIVNWEGPDAQYDSISVAEVGEKSSINSTRTARGNPLTLQMPAKPGNYEIRYVLHQGRTTLASRPVTVTEANVLLDAPEEASAGETIIVTWEGPDENHDRIGVAKAGEARLIRSTRTSKGNPLKLKMPDEPGEYEIRYLLHQGNTMLASRAVKVK